MRIKIIEGKDAIWDTDKYDVVLVGTTIYNMLTNGFQSKMKLKYPYIDEANDSTKYGDLRKLGKRITIEGKPIISLLYIAKYPHKNRVFLDYDALEHALATADSEFAGRRVMTTMIGTSLFDGNGDREKVLNIINSTVKRMDLDVYDYFQNKKRDEINALYRKIKSYETADNDRYKELWARREEIISEMYLQY